MHYRKALKSLSALWISSLIGSGSTFILYSILARKFGPEKFGLFSNVLAIISIIVLISGFGISKTWLKIFGKEGWKGVRWIVPSLKFLVFNLLVITFFLITFGYSGLLDITSRKLLILMIFHVYGYTVTELVISKFQLEEDYMKMSKWQLIPNVLRLLSIASSIYLFKVSLDIIDVGFIYFSVGVLFSILGFFQLIKMYNGKFQLKGHGVNSVHGFETPKVKDVVYETWPFGLANLFAFIYLQSDIIMVKYISGDIQTGHYNVSFIILSAVFMVPTVVFSKFLSPKYHRWANHDIKKLHDVYKKGNILMVLIGILFMIVILIISPLFIPFIFGNEYQPTVRLLQILSTTIPIYFLTYSVGATLVTSEHMKLKVKLMGVVAVFNILFNIVLIPYYGNEGAAIATVISNIILLLLYWVSVKKRVFIEMNLE